jgi:peptidoglycan L-alanyl-D-glutamate endopeptidase CwlK
MQQFKLSQRSLSRLDGVDDRMVELAQRSIAKSPIDFGIPVYGGLRSPEKQKELFDAGKSKCDGYIRKSRHQSGRAFDVYAYHQAKASWDKIHLAIIAGVVLSEAKEMGLNVVWGGSFGSKEFHGWDYPHFELIE